MDAIKKIIESVSILMGMLPQLIELVKAIEVAFGPGPGRGPEKQGLVVALTIEAFNAIPEDVKARIGGDRLNAYIKTSIDWIVKFFNGAGIFKKG